MNRVELNLVQLNQTEPSPTLFLKLSKKLENHTHIGDMHTHMQNIDTYAYAFFKTFFRKTQQFPPQI